MRAVEAEWSADTGLDVAIVGMAGRFPQADNIEAFWRNIRDGVASVSRFTDAQLREQGVPQQLLDDPAYVKAGIGFEGADRFDAAFFGYTPREAEQLDPQQRLFLECAWEALEDAGYSGRRNGAAVGVYASTGANLYLMKHLLPRIQLGQPNGIAELLGLLNGNAPDALSTRVAYKLDLRGPALTVQTACSSSLMAAHLACQALMAHECDMALAGGVWLNLLQEAGYRHQPGAILSSDGHCRAFDARADGTALGSGVGIVVLKRLADAQRDGDTVHAVIKATAANNDGAGKVGYTAPSIDGQAGVIRAAHAIAGVTADSIGYVEAHGTGTTLGDPIEIAALARAFSATTDRRGFCAIGSVKASIGHLDAAAGIAGLIKTALALKHGTVPPCVNFESPNPRIDFANTPFHVPTRAMPWPSDGAPRRAGVSAFGMGGTNVHAVLEEAPPQPARPAAADGTSVLLLSARSDAALKAQALRLAQHIESHPGQALPDIAHTLAHGRARFEHRAALAAAHRAQAVSALKACAEEGQGAGRVLSDAPTVAFLFPGQGAQHVGMARALYDSEPLFRGTVDRCCEALLPECGTDLRQLLYPAAADEAQAASQLMQTAFTQPALFVVEYAMARLWMSWGVQPDALLGHSIGEYTAACVAGVFSLDDALRLVALRGRLMQRTEPGAMLAVGLPAQRLQGHLDAGCDLAALNADDWCVLSGPHAAIAAAERDLAGQGTVLRRLQVSHAFHSASVEPVLAEFGAQLRRIALQAPALPMLSNLTGRWMTAAEARDPDYWVQHLRGTVRFADGVRLLLQKPDRIPLEVGPGEGLSGLVRRGLEAGDRRPVLASQPRAGQGGGRAHLLEGVGRLWSAGVAMDEDAWPLRSNGRRRVSLPTYPFERRSYWVAPAPTSARPQPAPSAPAAAPDFDDWFLVPTWQRRALDGSDPRQPVAGPGVERAAGCTVVYANDGPLANALCEALQRQGGSLVRVQAGTAFERLGRDRYVVRPAERPDHARLLRQVAEEVGAVGHLVHLWSLGGNDDAVVDQQERGFFSLLAIGQALHEARPAGGAGAMALTVVSDGVADVTGTEALRPQQATLLGPVRVLPLELPGLRCRLVDVDAAAPSDAALRRTAGQIAADVLSGDGEPLVAWRGIHRWVQRFDPAPRPAGGASLLRPKGVYVITGGLGGIGRLLARRLAQQWQARVVLLSRRPRPPHDAVKDLEDGGAEVLAIQADVTDPVALQAALRQARDRFGAIHGIIHAAGEAGGGLLAHRSSADACRVMAPKVRGTSVLLEAARDLPLDFIALCSSVTGLTGAIGQVDYCAANAAVDAFAAAAARGAGPRVLAIAWDTWQGTGMAAAQRTDAEVGITAEEGVRAFERILQRGSGDSQVVVSRWPMARQLARARQADVALVAAAVPAPPRDSVHGRPGLAVEYVEPSTPLETRLAGLWSEALGIHPVGVNDSLFALGGDSLLAVQLLARVRADFGVDLPPADFLQSPCVADVARLVELRLIDELEREEAAPTP